MSVLASVIIRFLRVFRMFASQQHIMANHQLEDTEKKLAEAGKQAEAVKKQLDAEQKSHGEAKSQVKQCQDQLDKLSALVEVIVEMPLLNSDSVRASVVDLAALS